METRRYECCHCVSEAPAPETLLPNSTGCAPCTEGSCCAASLSCPAGYELSQALEICFDCSVAEHYAKSLEEYDWEASWQPNCPQDEMGIWCLERAWAGRAECA